MKVKNFEFKAKGEQLEKYENILLKLNPVDLVTEHHIDTYFNTANERLKLREILGKESKLIDYKRENIQGSKKSDILLYKDDPNESLKQILTNQMSVKVIVVKKRKIYRIDNVKFHFDIVEKLGTFIEVEAIDETGEFKLNELKKQCDYYYDYFDIQQEQVEQLSYSDLLIDKTEKL